MTVVFFVFASCRAMEAAHVVLPTPPLPARKVSLRTTGLGPAGRAVFRRRDGGGPAGGTPALQSRILSGESSGTHARGAITTRGNGAWSPGRARLRITN